jgi:uncharacterized protein YcfJ
MRSLKALLMISAIGLAACGKKDNVADANKDFLLQHPASDQVISPAELGNADSLKLQPLAPTGVAPTVTPVASHTTSHASTTHHTSTAHRSTSGSSSSGTVYAPAPAPRTVTVKHTKRDAIIGAGAGAVIGGIAGHGVKGAVVGGVLGGVLGGVIGNNVDKTKRRY